MKQDALSELSKEFAIEMIRFANKLREQHEFIISNQIGRSASSIGANIREAAYAESPADFVHKLRISLKEANETNYWLELLLNCEYISKEEYTFFERKCTRIKMILIKSINTARNNHNI